MTFRRGLTRAAAALGLAVALAAGCGTRREAEPTAHSALHESLERAAAAALDEHRVPALAVVVTKGDEILLAKASGMADALSEQPVSVTTEFQLGSISKTILAALVLKLAEQGRLSIDDPVTRHLPDFKHLARIRVRHLLDQTSGIREPFTLTAYQDGIEDLARKPEELVEILQTAPVDFPPGSRWSYSNANYQLLALILERVAGTPYEQQLEQAFFGPLGLSSLRHCTSIPKTPVEARGHLLRDDGFAYVTPENMGWIRGDGGLCGNAPDLARWVRLLATGRLISPASYALMSAPTRLGDGKAVDYGFALSTVPLDGKRKVAHNGAMPGFSASAAYYPDDGLTVVVLTNRGNVRTEAIERRLARLALGLPDPDYTARELPPGARDRYLGSYDIGVFTIQVTDRAGQLWLEMPRPGPTTPLRYVGHGRFVSETDPDAYQLAFPEAQGPAAEVTLLMAAMHWYGVR